MKTMRDDNLRNSKGQKLATKNDVFWGFGVVVPLSILGAVAAAILLV